MPSVSGVALGRLDTSSTAIFSFEVLGKGSTISTLTVFFLKLAASISTR